MQGCIQVYMYTGGIFATHRYSERSEESHLLSDNLFAPRSFAALEDDTFGVGRKTAGATR